MMKRILYFIASACLLLSTTACGDFLEEYSQDLARVKSFEDLNEILIGNAYLPTGLVVNAGYSVTPYNTNYMILHLMTDELSENDKASDLRSYGGLMRDDMFPYFTWQQDVTLNYQKRNVYGAQEDWFFNGPYTYISTCNMVLFEADNLTATNDEEALMRDKIKGEAHFLRALYYQLLVNLYAKPYDPATAAQTPGVPVKTSESIEDIEYTRNSVQEVYDQIVADLEAAEQYLKDVHQPYSIQHAGINAVYMLHSRVALYMQDWQTAKKYAELSLMENDDLRNIAAGFDGTFIEPNNEEISFVMGGETFGNTNFPRPGQSYYGTYIYSPNWIISDHLYNLYEEGDARRDVFFGREYGDGNAPYYKKTDIEYNHLGSYKGTSDQFCYRSAEAYLNAAEAEAQLGNDQAAQQYLNKLRAARIADAKPVTETGAQLIQFIRDERQRELCLEGVRWFDMRRYTVDPRYKLVEKVKHSYSVYQLQGYSYVKGEVATYELSTDDGGMVLDIPKSVREFQNSIGSNPRPERKSDLTVN